MDTPLINIGIKNMNANVPDLAKLLILLAPSHILSLFHSETSLIQL